jgi:L-lactate permease
MNKLGYFLAGVIAGAVGLGAAAFLVDDAANNSLTDETDAEEEETAEEAENSSAEGTTATSGNSTTASPSDTPTPEEPAQA